MTSPIKSLMVIVAMALALAVGRDAMTQTPPSPNPRTGSPALGATANSCGVGATYDELTGIHAKPPGPIELMIYSVERDDTPADAKGPFTLENCSSRIYWSKLLVSVTGEYSIFSAQGGFSSGGGMGGGQLSADSLAILGTLLDSLPDDGRRVPPPGHRVIVQVVRGGVVTVRLYDRSYLPDAVLEMLRMTDAGFARTEHTFEPSRRWSREEAQKSGGIPGQFVGNWTKNIGATLAISPDGTMMATEDFDKENLRIYKLATGDTAPELVHIIPEQPDGRRRVYATYADFSPDGRILMVVTNRPEVRPVDVASWQPVNGSKLIPEGVIGFYPSPDWTRGVAVQRSGAVTLWDRTAQRTSADLQPDGLLDWVRFSPDDALVAVASHTASDWRVQLRIWDVRSGDLAKGMWPPAKEWNVRGAPLWWRGFLIFQFAEENAPGGIGLWDAATGRLRGLLNSCGGLVAQSNRLLEFCSVGPDRPNGVLEWSLDSVERQIADWEQGPPQSGHAAAQPDLGPSAQ